MWFLHDGTGWALSCLTHGELAWFFHEPHTGLEDCLNMLLSCLRKRMSDLRDGRIQSFQSVSGKPSSSATAERNHSFSRLMRKGVPRNFPGLFFCCSLTLIQGDSSNHGLGWVYLNFECSTVCPILLGLLGIWQKQLGKTMNIQIKVN